MARLLLLAIILVNFVHSCVAASGECQAPLGMEEGRIPDNAISASSSYEVKSVGPQNARIRQELNGGAWCPKAQISSTIREYLEVDLVKNHLITWTETQGRFGNGQGQEYAEAYLVEYWRDSLQQWVVYKDTRGEKVLAGNSNTYLVVKQPLELPFVASRVRFIPYSEHPRTVCMRVELYGCPWEQSVVSYMAPKGDSEFEDLSYDGYLDGVTMRGGLGQLVDGVLGSEDFLDETSTGSRWVGWLNDSQDSEPLEIIFEFDGVREFSAMHLHTSHVVTRDVQVFSEAMVYMSLDGERYQPTPVKFHPLVERPRDLTANITIPLHNRIGRFLRLQLRFSSRWILLSEVSFDSAFILGNVTEESLEQFYLQQQDSVQDIEPQSGVGGDLTTHARKEVTPATSPASNTQAYIGLITGVLAMVVLLAACTVMIMVRRGRKKVALLHKHTALVSSTTKPGVTINMKDLKMNMSTPIINNGVSRSRLATKGKTGIKKNSIYGHMGGEESEDSENSSVYHEPYKLLPSGKQEYGCLLKKETISSSKSGEYTDFTSVNSFADEVKFSSPSLYNLTPPPPPASRPPPYELTTNFNTTTLSKSLSLGSAQQQPLENYYAATDIVKTERREQHLTTGKFTPMKLPEGTPKENSPILEMSRHRLRVIEKLGEGLFGMIHLCESDGVPEYNGVSSYHKKQVLVKSLWRGCSESTKKEFLRETAWLASLRDPNLVRVVGLCSQEEPLCILQEHCEFGDLPTFLQLQAGAGAQDNNPAISYGCLIYLATQVASGMKYLEALDIAHRDLAARNCMVGKNYQLKVSDHAMYCSQYEADYYVSDTKAKLPIRWMAWESLLLGKHTPKSDVWSFAVTLWEILMLCAQRPFAELTNEQVVENCSHWYQGNGQQRTVPRPAACPREIYDLMGECWKRQEEDRPRFTEIHLFLQRKNLGFVPAIG
ncbi:discoidin domain-containing receptor 2-like isoform X2 [Macrosteles quadrilineatus]|uniref:discoidin domain-containing receptor 2-like isoform X2 n=1 Tax=Macrosteles quadrilineatus TaxID=74068 RepID=UPI0023E118B5|nr:discoidin domain-containing receptor 2-like isoform X2 [Macrosteles quadrilineatus]